MTHRYIRVILRHVGLRRGDRTVLRDIDWTISPGERWILAGANGAGKTQLLKLVSGSVWPSPRVGTIRRYALRGERHDAPREVMGEIAYVGPERQDRYDRYGWNFTAAEIVGTGLHRSDIPLDPLTQDDRLRIARLLGKLALAHLADRRLLELSYGERRLVLLARALAARPKLLLLDELLAGLDAANHAAARAWLESTGRSRLPWVLAAHRLEDVPRGATHLLWLVGGRVAFRGPIARAPLERLLRAPLSGRRASKAVVVPRRRRTRSLIRMANASVYIDDREVLKRFSLDVAAGECWVVHGPNGSGKSTLLRTLYGDYGVAAGGRIERAGIGPGVPLEVFKRTVGFIAPHLQSSAASARSVLPSASAGSVGQPLAAEPRDLTVGEVVQSGRHASLGLDAPPSAADRRAAERALEAFGLASFATRSLSELSYGQQRRVFFARAWVHRPRLVLLDEPFSGLDAATRAALLERVEALAARGTTVVMATHHREEWPRTATHELELRAGRIRYGGPIRSEHAKGLE